MTRTVAGLYDTYQDAVACVRDLQNTGIPENQISLVANDRHNFELKEGTEAAEGATNGGLGGALVAGGAGLLVGLGVVAIPGVGPVVAAGWLVATAVGAVGGAVAGAAGGGLIGSMIGNGVPEGDAHVYAEGVRRGSNLVTVRAEDALAPRVETIMQKYRPIDAAVRGVAFRDQGWVSFDANAPPYVDAERGAQQTRPGR